MLNAYTTLIKKENRIPKVHKKPMRGSLGTAFIIEKVLAQRKLSCAKCIYFDPDGSCNKLRIVISEVGYDYFKHCKHFAREDKPKKQWVQKAKTKDGTKTKINTNAKGSIKTNHKSKVSNKPIKGIRINSHVELYDVTFKEKVKYQLVESSRANPMEGKISIDSPLGKALLGKKQGQEVLVDTPSGMDTYKILFWK